MENLTQTEREFLRTYFVKVGSIWTEYFDDRLTMKPYGMSTKKRDDLLTVYRDELNRIRRKIK